jgi:UPF0755 protein
MFKRLFFVPLLVFFVVMGAGFGAALWWLNQPLIVNPNPNLSANLSTNPPPPLEVTIEAGSGVKAASNAVAKATGANPLLLLGWFRAATWAGDVSKGAKSIKAGTYAIEPDLTPRTLLAKLVAGDEILLSLTIPEGWTFKQMRAAVGAAPHLKHTTVQLSDDALMTQLGKAGVVAEGRFFPDTYAYAKGASDISIYKQALATLDKRLQAAWESRHSALPLKNADELLVLASIVEKETGKPTDRAEIAGVFVNRLKAGMLLQTDPTVIYGMGERFAAQRGNIRKSDLKRDTPYNTYTRAGLPPGPIALVGKAALAAAAQPKTTDALYFVARGDGSSEFSVTLAQHNAAVNRFIRGR